MAKVVETEDSDLEDPAGFRPSSIRQQNATLLDELDNRYSGAVVKRKSLQVESSESENSIQSDVDQSESDQEEIEDENGEDQDEEGETRPLNCY